MMRAGGVKIQVAQVVWDPCDYQGQVQNLVRHTFEDVEVALTARS
jgi:hypothetical protein